MKHPFASARRPTLRGLLAAATMTLGAWGSAAAGDPARMLIPFPAGGAADVMGRLLADKLKVDLGQQVLVENKPGAGTRLAAEALKQAKPDGLTVLLTTIEPLVIAPAVYPNLRFNPATDFTPITEVASLEFSLVVDANSPYRSVGDYVKAAKSTPQQAMLGITSPGTTAHFFAFDFATHTKVEISLVPFQGGPALVTNLIGGQVPAAVDATTVFSEHHRNKKLRILAVSSAKRLPDLPEVPTFVESGYPTLVAGATYVLYAPAGTPPAALARWNAAMRKALAQPDLRAKLEKMGYDVSRGSNSEEVAAKTRRIADRLLPVVKASGFKGD